jgi:hypothetical protein
MYMTSREVYTRTLREPVITKEKLVEGKYVDAERRKWPSLTSSTSEARAIYSFGMPVTKLAY